MKRRLIHPAIAALTSIVFVIVLASPLRQAKAQDQLCFNVPGITNCISGRFREYWQQNGGLDVFGYPITPAANQTTPQGTFLTQYFERNSFEMHPEKARPYDVLLGLLGVQLLQRSGTNWETLPKANPAAPHYFPETGHAISTEAFWQYWSTHGLQDPALSPYQRSLALFGFPLSEAAQATNSSGDTVLTQWFERARFEYHPNEPDPYKVLLGLLGNEWRAAPPPPPPTPTTQQRITISAPASGAAVDNPFRTTGDVAVTPPGATLSYQVFNSGNNVIGQGVISVLPAADSARGRFDANISFTPPAPESAITLLLFQPGASGQPPIASASVPLIYRPVVTQAIRIDAPAPNEVIHSSPVEVRGSTVLYPRNGQLHYIVYGPNGIIGEGNFAVQSSGNGSTFDSNLTFTAPTASAKIQLDISELNSSGGTVTKSGIPLQFEPPAPTQQSITIDAPVGGTVVANTFASTGRTTLIPAAGKLIYGVLDANNQIIGQGDIPITASGPGGQGGTWNANLTFSGGVNGTDLRLEILEAGCAGCPPVARATRLLKCCILPPGLANTSWDVLAYNNGTGGVASVLNGTSLTASFNATNISGSAGCNDYSGTYQSDGRSTISVGTLAVTQRICPEPAGLMDQETRYLAALRTAATYTINGNQLELRTAAGTIAAQLRRK